MAESSQNRSVYRLRWVGYGLLILALIDAIVIFIPPGFTNPAWELQTIGQLVERVVVPLLGFALVFFGEFYDRVGSEKIALKILSWLCLLLTVLFLLMVPLGVLDTLRVNGATEQQVKQQVDQRLGALKQIEDRLNQNRPEDLQALATQLKSQGIPVDTSNPEKLRADVLARAKAVREQTQQQAREGVAGQQQTLFKNSVKWNIGALIASVLFFILWKSTDWARE